MRAIYVTAIEILAMLGIIVVSYICTAHIIHGNTVMRVQYNTATLQHNIRKPVTATTIASNEIRKDVHGRKQRITMLNNVRKYEVDICLILM